MSKTAVYVFIKCCFVPLVLSCWVTLNLFSLVIKYYLEKAIYTIWWFYYLKQNPFCLFSLSELILVILARFILNNKSPNLHDRAKPWRILAVVVKWRYCENGLSIVKFALAIKCVLVIPQSLKREAFFVCVNTDTLSEVFDITYQRSLYLKKITYTALIHFRKITPSISARCRGRDKLETWQQNKAKFEHL